MYKPKDHKAHDLRKRNDYLVGLIKNQFTATPTVSDDFYTEQQDKKNKQFDQHELNLRKLRLEKELEAKRYQDIQVLEKQKEKEVER